MRSGKSSTSNETIKSADYKSTNDIPDKPSKITTDAGDNIDIDKAEDEDKNFDHPDFNNEEEENGEHTKQHSDSDNDDEDYDEDYDDENDNSESLVLSKVINGPTVSALSDETGKEMFQRNIDMLNIKI